MFDSQRLACVAWVSGLIRLSAIALRPQWTPLAVGRYTCGRNPAILPRQFCTLSLIATERWIVNKASEQ